MSVETFLKQRAVNVLVGGRYTLPNWYDPQGKLRTFSCRTSRVSPFRMIVSVPVVGKIGDRVTSYFDDFGKLNGVISDTIAGGFLFELDGTSSMRERLARKLVWLQKKQKDTSVIDARQDARIIPESPHSTLVLADGTVESCFVIDMSVSGVAVSADLQPQIGTPMAVGACVGRVVRIFQDGFAVKFIEPLDRKDLDRQIARPAPLASAHKEIRLASHSA